MTKEYLAKVREQIAKEVLQETLESLFDKTPDTDIPDLLQLLARKLRGMY